MRKVCYILEYYVRSNNLYITLKLDPILKFVVTLDINFKTYYDPRNQFKC